MIIYIDLVILSTILVNYSFIKLIYIINNLHYSKIRLFVSTVVSTFSIILFFIPFKYISIIRHLYGIVVGIVAFKINSLKITIKMITSFYILNYLFIGTLVIFKIDKAYCKQFYANKFKNVDKLDYTLEDRNHQNS